MAIRYKLSIIIATCNRREALAECLAALPWEAMTREQVEVIVVVDGAADGTAAWLKEAYPAVRCIATSRQVLNLQEVKQFLLL